MTTDIFEPPLAKSIGRPRLLGAISLVSQHGILIVFSLFTVFPLYWMVLSSVKPLGEILNSAFYTARPTLESYKEALSAIPIARMTLNTLLIASIQTLSQLLTACLASYALVRWDFYGKNFIVALLSLTWLIPIQAIMIPNYVTLASMGLRNTLIGVILPYAASVFAILKMYYAFQSFPKALIEAARLDGFSELAILFRIVMPNIRASLVSLALILFINGWNEYIWAMLVNSKLEWAPIQIGIQFFMSMEGNSWGPLMAAATLSCLPILLIYLVLQRHIINSFVKWGIK